MEKEIKKANLSDRERVTMYELLDRVRTNAQLPGDTKKLEKDLWEVRIDGDRRILRLLYSETVDQLLGLRFFSKKDQKDQKVRKSDKATARKRLAEWNGRAAMSKYR